MGSRGRANVLELTSHPLDAGVRMLPPRELTVVEREVWISVVNEEAPDWFTASNAPLLVQYCRHVVVARELGRRMEACDPTSDTQYIKLGRMQSMNSAVIMGLATKMRLSQRSTVNTRGNKKPRTAKASRQLYNRQEG